MKKIVLSLGGSFVSPKAEADIERTAAIINAYVQWLKRLAEQSLVIVIVGGGNRARVAMAEAKQHNSTISNAELDEIGIAASRENARQLQTQCAGTRAFLFQPDTKLGEEPGLVFGGGWKPGRSTDYCAVQVAISNGVATVTNISNIEHLFTKDPKIFPDAKPLESVSWSELRAIVGDTWVPGLNAPFDPIAAKLAAEHHLTVNIVNGWMLPNVELAIAGKPFIGTVVHP